MKRFGLTRDDWPYQPWPGQTSAHWEDAAPVTAKLVPQSSGRKWLLLALVPVLVIGLAGVAVARLLADDTATETSSEDSFGNFACADQHLAGLVREHREAVSGL